MELNEIRRRWNEVLDALLQADRVAWLAFFDARIAAFDGKTLVLDFTDTRKLGAAHEFSTTRIKHQQLLVSVVKVVLDINVEITEQ